jgi:hypothetical protein
MLASKERWRRWYLVSFGSSVVWIGAISYLMVEFAIHLGRCIGVSTGRASPSEPQKALVQVFLVLMFEMCQHIYVVQLHYFASCVF